MSNSRHKREAAAEHNARLDREAHKHEARALFDWLQKLGPAPVRPAQPPGEKERRTRTARTVLLMGAMGAAHALAHIDMEPIEIRANAHHVKKGKK